MRGPDGWRPRSVRARSTLLAVLAVTAVLVLASVLLVGTLSRSLTRAEDDQARARAAELAGLAASGDLPAVVTGISDDSLAQVVSGEGTVLAASANIAGRPAVSDFLPDGDRPAVRTMRGLPDDQEREDYRVWALRTMTPDGDAVVYVGPSLEASQETVARLTRSLLLGLPPLILLLALAIWYVVGRALRPVEAIRAEVATLSAHDLDRRVPVPATGDEVARLAATMNAMLARLQAADARQREFVANASHDLQSPLTAFRAELEVALAHPEAVDWQATARSLAAETARMESLVADLLFLARAEDAALPEPRMLDLDDVVREEVERLRPSAAVAVHADVTAAPVRGRRDDLARMVRNLLANALAHAATRVDLSLRTDGDGRDVVLAVEDDGPGVPAEHRDRVFDRFYRVDSARDRTRPGTGLGLAIVRSVAEGHGGTVRIEAGSRFLVRIPGA
jgi:signal transduction histidine kinase